MSQHISSSEKSFTKLQRHAKRRSMRRRKRVSIFGKKWMVLAGKRIKTKSGLKASDLCKNKQGKVVSKKKSARGKKSGWMQAVVKARKAMGIKGFQLCGGKTAKGQALYRKAKSFYKK